MTPRPPSRTALALFLALAGTLAHAEPSDQARRLAELRGEVERAAAEVDEIRDEARSKMRSLETQRIELEARVRIEEARLAELERRAERQRAEVADEAVAGAVLLPVLLDELAALRAQVAGGLPYRVPERLAQIDELSVQLRAGTLTPQRGALRVWQLVEDELRLTRENVLDRQVVAWRGDEVLVDVARLGMVALFVRAPDGRFGVARRDGASWRIDELSGGAERSQVGALFASLDKQVRVGPFELPIALPGEAR
jgi:hypothetical protein